MKKVFLESYDSRASKEVCDIMGGELYLCPFAWQGNQLEIYKAIENSDVVYIWNSLEPCVQWFVDICNVLNKDYLFIENGFIPQSNFYHLDTQGIIKHSSLNQSLDWLSNKDEENAINYLTQFINNKYHKMERRNFILCPLQIPWDTSIYLCSKYKNMEEFIWDVHNNNPKEILVIKPHPKQLNPKFSQDLLKHPQIKIITDSSLPTIQFARAAKKVIGINSTILYETLAIDCPTEAYGECPIRTHNSSKKVLYAAMAQQFHKRNKKRFEDLTKFLLERKKTIGY
jgi:capsule polysaccharide modification protein KpsS